MPSTLTALRASLKTADPHRPGVSRMKRDELEFLLQHIAEGGAIFPDPNHVEPLPSFGELFTSWCGFDPAELAAA